MAHDVVGNIGNTPLLRLARLTEDLPGIEIYGKAEYFNPGGSVKDRPALNMILEGERAGLLTPGKILLDSTSGNTGIAYSMLGAARGYKVRLCLPQNASPERKKILRAYGAELILTPGDEGSDGSIRKVREIYAANPELYFYPDQYSNDANWQAHYKTTAPEIIEQTNGRVTHFVALLGTSGTFIGTSRPQLTPKAGARRVLRKVHDRPPQGMSGKLAGRRSAATSRWSDSMRSRRSGTLAQRNVAFGVVRPRGTQRPRHPGRRR